MRKVLVVASVLVAAFSLRASLDGYFMLAGFSRGQLPSPAYSIYGGRLSLIYGDCHELYGFDTGIAGTTQENAYGLQINAVWSGVDADMAGAQIGLVNTVNGAAAGFQCGAFDWSAELFGCQVGVINLSDDCNGAQIGFWNGAHDVYGCQLGVVNVAKKLYGCQLGLVNVETACDMPVWLLLNIGW